jgi:hypothetical protein
VGLCMALAIGIATAASNANRQRHAQTPPQQHP